MTTRKSITKPSLAWSRQSEEPDCIEFRASYGDMCFYISIILDLPSAQYGWREIEMAAWVDEGDTPIVEKSVKVRKSVEWIESNISTYQTFLLSESARLLEERVRLIRSFIPATDPAAAAKHFSQ